LVTRTGTVNLRTVSDGRLASIVISFVVCFLIVEVD
jgi:hypothetical protein